MECLKMLQSWHSLRNGEQSMCDFKDIVSSASLNKAKKQFGR